MITAQRNHGVARKLAQCGYLASNCSPHAGQWQPREQRQIILQDERLKHQWIKCKNKGVNHTLQQLAWRPSIMPAESDHFMEGIIAPWDPTLWFCSIPTATYHFFFLVTTYLLQLLDYMITEKIQCPTIFPLVTLVKIYWYEFGYVLISSYNTTIWYLLHARHLCRDTSI